MTERRIVVGSGPNAVGVTHALLKRGFEVTMLDIGEELEPQKATIVEMMARQEPHEWSDSHKAIIQSMDFSGNAALNPKRAFGSSFAYYTDPDIQAPRGMRLYGSQAFGGLSNVWGCALLKATPAELSGWPPEIIEGIVAAYPTVQDLLYRSIGNDVLSTEPQKSRSMIGAAAKGVLNRYDQSPALHVAIDLYPTPLAISQSCKLCNGCMYGCVYGYTYSTQSTIRNIFMQNRNFRYVPGMLVTRFEEFRGGVKIYAQDQKKYRTEIIDAKQLFVAAGLMASLRIVWNSFPDVARVLSVRDSSCLIIPGILISSNALQNQMHHGLSHISADLHDSPFDQKPAHFQLYFKNPAVVDGLMSRLGLQKLWPMRSIVEFANQFLVFSQGYLHSDFCHRLKLEYGPNGIVKAAVEYNPETAKLIDIALLSFTRIMRKLGIVFLRHFAEITPSGGSKSAGALPHSHIADPASTDLLGRPFQSENVFIVDATVMPSIPGKNITLTTLANAVRIGKLA